MRASLSSCCINFLSTISHNSIHTKKFYFLKYSDNRYFTFVNIIKKICLCHTLQIKRAYKP